MNISGIRPKMGFYDYNDIRAKQVEQIQGVEAVGSVSKVSPAEKVTAIDETVMAQARERQTFSAYDYAQQYDARESFGMKGADAELVSLDVTKAVADMQRDSVIQQYQYFVGNENQVNPEAVRSIENFSL